MSIDAINWAFRLNVTGAEKSTLLALADHANHSGECFPSIGRIARWAGLSERGAQKAIRSLEAAGLVSTTRQNGKPSIYFLHIEITEIASPTHVVHPERSSPPPERGSPPPPNHVHPTPERGSPKPPLTIKRTTKEPSTRAREAPAEFDAFWMAYPRKVGKGAAAKAYTKAVKRATGAAIMAGLANAVWSDDGKFIPHPATWLNQDRWLDEVDTRDPVLSALGIPQHDERECRKNVIEFPMLAGVVNG